MDDSWTEVYRYTGLLVWLHWFTVVPWQGRRGRRHCWLCVFDTALCVITSLRHRGGVSLQAVKPDENSRNRLNIKLKNALCGFFSAVVSLVRS